MWCRVLLFVIALTCTFQREITADIDDVICVVILSGLQKEDLDENLLAKLQRHNMNIDDINNRETIEKCVKRSSSDKPEENGYAKENMPTRSEQSEQIQINHNINKTIQVEEISKENKTNISTSVENNAYIESHTIPSYENFIKLWTTLNNTSHQDNEVKPTKETEKDMIVQLPFSFEKDTNIDSKAKGLTFINKMFETYISATKAVTTTIKPSTTNYQQKNQVDTVSQQIMKILKNNYNNHSKSFVDREYEDPKSKQTSKSKINYNDSETTHIKEKSMGNQERTILKPSEIINSISRNTILHPNFENLVKLWIKLNKTTHQDLIKDIEKSVTVRATYDEVTKSDSQATDLDLVNKILGSYFSQKAVTTIIPTTTEKPIDILSQQIKKFLQNHSINYNTSLGDRTIDETFRNQNVDLNYLHDEKSPKKNKNPGPLAQHFENVKKLEENLRIVKTTSNLNEYLPINLNENTNADSESKYINMLKDYFATKYMQTSTQLPTTTPKHIDVVLQKLNEFFKNYYMDDQKLTANGPSESLGNKDLNAYKRRHNNDQDWLSHKSVSMQSKNELHDQYQSTIPRPYETNTKDNQLNNFQIVQAKDDVRSQRMPITFNNETKDHSKELDHIFHMIQYYIATKDAETTTLVPTVTPTHFDVIAQKLKEYLDINDNKYRRIMVTQVPAKNKNVAAPKVHTDGKLLVTRKIDYMKEIQRQANQKIANSLDTSSKILQQNTNSQIVQNKFLKENTPNDTTNTEAKLLPEDVIRQITENVKASVLKDLQKQMFTTLRSVTKATTKTTTTKTIDHIYSATTRLYNSDKLIQRFKKESGVETTTESPSTITLHIDQNKIKTATSALENFMDLFEQFKHLRNSVPTPTDLKHTLIQKGKTKNEFHGPINVVYPSLLPLNYPYNVNNTEAVSPMFVNPYGIHINNPTLKKTKITNEIQKFILDPRHNMESKMKHAVHASVIQTDDVQVPLLGIPVSKSVSPINQNIIVTTKHPKIQFREDHDHRSITTLQKPTHQDYTIRGYGKDDSNSERQSNKDLGKYSGTDMDRYYNDDMTRYHSDMERAYGRGRYLIPNYNTRIEKDRLSPRSKQASFGNDNFYQEYLSNIRSKSDKPWDVPEYLQERKRERFHEKLERPDEWQYRFRDRETPKKDKPLNVASRQQLSLSDLKKKKRYNDSHYLNFLKSQQKVNDMLEKMLKPKNRLSSVEAI